MRLLFIFSNVPGWAAIVRILEASLLNVGGNIC